jgi:MoxR-like ATPase
VNVEDVSARARRICAEVGRVLIGQEEPLVTTLAAILARGHVLIEGVPGLGKTLLVRALSHTLGCSFRRIQFTPDLMPSDVTGGNVFNQRTGTFDFHPGPIFTELLLADEINRAPAKTQSALLEAMQENAVTADGTTRRLPEPFFVIATQNPIESHGTYPLPEAQLDRFLMKLHVTHPTPEMERVIVRNHLDGFEAADLEASGLSPIVSQLELVEMQRALSQVRVDDEIVAWVTELVGRTRKHRSVDLGASPRASIALVKSARARAAIDGRGFVVPDDVKAFAHAVLRHRLVLQPDAELEGATADDVVAEVLRDTRVPGTAAA